MSFTASPEQLEILRQAVALYCHDCGIVDEEEQLYLAEMVSALFDLGALGLHDLRQGLDDAIGPCSKPTPLVR
jgi:hypothetical protein